MCRNPSFIIKAILNITVFCYIIKYLLGKLRRPRRNNAANAPTCAAPLRRNVYGVCIYNHHSLNAVHSPVPWDSFQFSLLFCSSWLFLLSNEIEMCPISGKTRSDRRCELTSLRESPHFCSQIPLIALDQCGTSRNIGPIRLTLSLWDLTLAFVSLNLALRYN